MELSRFFSKAVCDSKDLSFGGGLACSCCLINTLAEPHIEAVEKLFGVEQCPQLCVVCCEVLGKDPHIVAIEVSNLLQSRDRGLSRERVLKGG